VAKLTKKYVKIKSENWDGNERRVSLYNITDEKRRTMDKVNADYVPTKNDERYQFESLVILYRARFNVWQVMDMKKPSFQQIIFEVVGYANQVDAFMWAKEYVKEIKYKNKEDDE
jgi:hypothetical protein